MHRYNFLISLILIYTFTSCSVSNYELILKLQNEKKTTQVVLNSIEAGRRGDFVFVKYLLANSFDYSTSTNLKCYNQSIYGSKMKALERIFRKSPEMEITQKPDSDVIKFYTKMAVDAKLI